MVLVHSHKTLDEASKQPGSCLLSWSVIQGPQDGSGQTRLESLPLPPPPSCLHLIFLWEVLFHATQHIVFITPSSPSFHSLGHTHQRSRKLLTSLIWQSSCSASVSLWVENSSPGAVVLTSLPTCFYYFSLLPPYSLCPLFSHLSCTCCNHMSVHSHLQSAK